MDRISFKCVSTTKGIGAPSRLWVPPPTGTLEEVSTTKGIGAPSRMRYYNVPGCLAEFQLRRGSEPPSHSPAGKEAKARELGFNYEGDRNSLPTDPVDPTAPVHPPFQLRRGSNPFTASPTIGRSQPPRPSFNYEGDRTPFPHCWPRVLGSPSPVSTTKGIEPPSREQGIALTEKGI